MDTEPTNIPPIEDGAGGLERHFLDLTRHFDAPHYTLQYKGVPFAPLGGIQAITGHKKNGKTFLMCQLMAAALDSGSERMRAGLPGLELTPGLRERLASEGRAATVLYVDTEMEQLNTALVARRVHWLCGWPLEANDARFRVMWLRTVADNAERRRIVLEAVRRLRPVSVFVDGVRDLVRDFNDNAEAAGLVGELMQAATEQECCIWCALHFNPRPGDAEAYGKMRGHLGTELGNKATDTFSSAKRKTAEGVTFTVKQVDARGKDVEDWAFEVSDCAGGLGIPRMTAAMPATATRRTDEGLEATAEALREILRGGLSMDWQRLIDALESHTGWGERKCRTMLNAAKKAGHIKTLPGDHKWFLGAMPAPDGGTLPFAPAGEPPPF